MIDLRPVSGIYSYPVMDGGSAIPDAVVSGTTSGSGNDDSDYTSNTSSSFNGVAWITTGSTTLNENGHRESEYSANSTAGSLDETPPAWSVEEKGDINDDYETTSGFIATTDGWVQTSGTGQSWGDSHNESTRTRRKSYSRTVGPDTTVNGISGIVAKEESNSDYRLNHAYSGEEWILSGNVNNDGFSERTEQQNGSASISQSGASYSISGTSNEDVRNHSRTDWESVSSFHSDDGWLASSGTRTTTSDGHQKSDSSMTGSYSEAVTGGTINGSLGLQSESNFTYNQTINESIFNGAWDFIGGSRTEHDDGYSSTGQSGSGSYSLTTSGGSESGTVTHSAHDYSDHESEATFAFQSVDDEWDWVQQSGSGNASGDKSNDHTWTTNAVMGSTTIEEITFSTSTINGTKYGTSSDFNVDSAFTNGEWSDTGTAHARVDQGTFQNIAYTVDNHQISVSGMTVIGMLARITEHSDTDYVESTFQLGTEGEWTQSELKGGAITTDQLNINYDGVGPYNATLVIESESKQTFDVSGPIQVGIGPNGEDELDLTQLTGKGSATANGSSDFNFSDSREIDENGITGNEIWSGFNRSSFDTTVEYELDTTPDQEKWTTTSGSDQIDTSGERRWEYGASGTVTSNVNGEHELFEERKGNILDTYSFNLTSELQAGEWTVTDSSGSSNRTDNSSQTSIRDQSSTVHIDDFVSQDYTRTDYQKNELLNSSTKIAEYEFIDDEWTLTRNDSTIITTVKASRNAFEESDQYQTGIIEFDYQKDKFDRTYEHTTTTVTTLSSPSPTTMINETETITLDGEFSSVRDDIHVNQEWLVEYRKFPSTPAVLDEYGIGSIAVGGTEIINQYENDTTKTGLEAENNKPEFHWLFVGPGDPVLQIPFGGSALASHQPLPLNPAMPDPIDLPTVIDVSEDANNPPPGSSYNGDPWESPTWEAAKAAAGYFLNMGRAIVTGEFVGAMYDRAVSGYELHTGGTFDGDLGDWAGIVAFGAIDLSPVGSAYQAYTGKDLATGEALTDWERAAGIFEVIGSAAGGLAVVAKGIGAAGKGMKAGGKLYSGGHEWIVVDPKRVNQVKAELSDFYAKNKPRGAKVQFAPVQGGNGYIDTVTGDIFIDTDFAKGYPHLLDGAILEELHHFKQLVENNWLGRKLSYAQIDFLEDDVVGRLLNSGLEGLY